MNMSATTNMELHLVRVHGEAPDNPIEALYTLFMDKMESNRITSQEKEGIGEYYRIIESRGLPAYQWMVEAINVLGKKDRQKRNIRYLVGIIRGWLKFGFGHLPSQEERDVVDFFEDVIGQEASQEAIHMIKQAMGKYGVVKLTRAIAKVETDKGLYMMVGLNSILESL